MIKNNISEIQNNYFTVSNYNEKIVFIKSPREFFKKDSNYNKLSDRTKNLYSLLFSLVSLSAKEGWVDNLGRIYVKKSYTNIQQELNCCKNSAIKSIKELEEVGLIEVVRHTDFYGTNSIYVMPLDNVNFTKKETEHELDPKAVQKEEQLPKKEVEQELYYYDSYYTDYSLVEASYGLFDDILENDSLDECSENEPPVHNVNPNNNNNINNTNTVYIINNHSSEERKNDKKLSAQDRELIKVRFKDNVKYNKLRHIADKPSASETSKLSLCICDMVLRYIDNPRYNFKQNGTYIKHYQVIDAFLNLDFSTIRAFAFTLLTKELQINNPEAYCLKSLYNEAYSYELNNNFRDIRGEFAC